MRGEAPAHRRAQGRALQVVPIKLMVIAPGTKRLKLKDDDSLSSFGFSFNLRPFIKAYHDADIAREGGGGGAGGGGEGGGGGGVYGVPSKGGGMITPSQSPSKAAPAAPAAPLSFAAQALANATALSPRKTGRRMRPVAKGKGFK